MKENRIDQALSALGFALKENQEQNPLNNPMEFVKKLPERSLSGNHIFGGKILEFSSSGISDLANSTQLTVTDKKVSVTNLSINKVLGDIKTEGNISSNKINATEATFDVLNVKEIHADIKIEKDTPVKFKADAGQGLLWTANDYTKQFVYNINPDQFFSSESINLANNRSFKINSQDVLSENELGPSVTKSNLKQVGRLQGLVVDGSISIGQWLIFNSASNRLGLGTENPNAAFSIIDNEVEVLVGAGEDYRGFVGTYASQGFDIVTDQTSRIAVSPAGDIQLGNTRSQPVQVGIHGKLSIKVNNPDPEVDLHVSGAIKYCGRRQQYDRNPPSSGSFNAGDIVWNIQPRMNSYVGWVCVSAGTPGEWAPFGKIGS